MATEHTEATDEVSELGSEAPRQAATFKVNLEKLGFARPDIPRMVAADVHKIPALVRIRTPSRQYEFSASREKVRAGPAGGSLQVERDPEDVPYWTRVVLQVVGHRGLFR